MICQWSNAVLWFYSSISWVIYCIKLYLLFKIHNFNDIAGNPSETCGFDHVIKSNVFGFRKLELPLTIYLVEYHCIARQLCARVSFLHECMNKLNCCSWKHSKKIRLFSHSWVVLNMLLKKPYIEACLSKPVLNFIKRHEHYIRQICFYVFHLSPSGGEVW